MIPASPTYPAYPRPPRAAPHATTRHGVNWVQRGSATVPLTATAYVGLAVASHLDGTLATGVFDSIAINPTGPPPVDTTPPSTPLNLAGSNGTSPGFGTLSSYSTATNTHSVIADDIDGDGQLDLVTANAASNSASVLRGTGSGTFQAATNWTVGSEPKTVRTGDFNADGRRDIVSSDQGAGALTVRLGTGSGAFGPAISYPACNNVKAHEAAVADLNGDGREDLSVPVTRPRYSASFSATAWHIPGRDQLFSVRGAAFPGTRRLRWRLRA